MSGPGAPDQPSAPVAEVIKMSTVRLKWDCPINNGAVITEYLLQVAVLESRKVVPASASTSSSSSPASTPTSGSPVKMRGSGGQNDGQLDESDRSSCSEDDDEQSDEEVSDDESLVS